MAVNERLAPFLPGPQVVRDADGRYRLERPGERPTSIGRMRAYQGSVGRAGARLCLHPDPRRRRPAARSATTRCWPRTTCAARVGEAYELPFEGPCKHEFVATARPLREATGVRTLDVAKRLIDYGFHPPTIYFPLLVEECLLIEPTETETLETSTRSRTRCWPSPGRPATIPTCCTTRP